MIGYARESDPETLLGYERETYPETSLGYAREKYPETLLEYARERYPEISLRRQTNEDIRIDPTPGEQLPLRALLMT